MSSVAAVLPEQPLFFESGGRQLYGLLGIPGSAGHVREAVLICSPAPFEIKKYHWTQRQLAQRLQAAGYHTLRFDYFATGDSEGESRDYDLDCCRLNIQDAIRYLKSSGMIRRVSIIGTRLACPLLLQAVATERVRRLILIDPILDGAAALAEARAMQDIMLREHLFAAPTYPTAALQTQLLGFPHSAHLSWQLQHLDTMPATIKAKSAVLVTSQGVADPAPLLEHLTPQLEEVLHLKVGDNLKWGDCQALQGQDFPSQLLQTVISAMRGAS